MKKTYITPCVEIQEMEVEQLMAVSIGYDGTGTGEADTKGETWFFDSDDDIDESKRYW